MFIEEISTFHMILSKFLIISSELSGSPGELIVYRCSSVHHCRHLPFTFFKDFSKISSETTWLIKWSLHGKGNKSLYKWSMSHDQDGRHAHTWKKLKKTFFSRTGSPMSLKLSMQYQGLKLYKVCINDDLGLTMTYFMARSNLVTYAFEWRKLFQSH